MRFLAFDKAGQPTIGVRRKQDIVDLLMEERQAER